MKIAIVGPSPVPFTIGGIENLMWGLCDTINQETKHQCELIKLPSRELSFWDLIDTYYSFYTLDVSHFDAVIYTKYPGWMVRHPKGICYMAHCLRGLYDTYPLMKLPYEVERGYDKIDALLDYMEVFTCPDDLDGFFKLVFALRGDASIPQEYFRFPGPFIRRLVWYMDRWGLNANKTIYYSSISKTVKERTIYYPDQTQVDVIYPPSTLKNYSFGDYKYIFMISRLDKPKRMDMLIRAMKYVETDIELLIAGTGPEREHLEELAKGDPRIKFLGFVLDEDVERYYRDSLVIPYFPYDEDYGYITVEAMLHGKPVITTKDAGGPKEFVVDGESGYVVDFEEKAIAEKIDYFAKNPEEAKRMGQNAYNIVKEITWSSVVNPLLSCLEAEQPDKKTTRKKITVTNAFPIVPATGGGQARIFNLYKQVAKEYDVEIVSFTGYGQPSYAGYIGENLREVRIPASETHMREEGKLAAKAKVPISDIAMILYASLTPDYVEAFKKSIQDSDYVIVSHPYLYNLVKEHIGNKPFIYEAHNVEYYMKKAVLPEGELAEELLKTVYDTEKECCENSAFIMTCSQEDAVKLNELYGITKKKMIVVPNGVDGEATTFTTIEQRLENKRKHKLEHQKMGVFMGSWHGPNLEACEKIFTVAKDCPDVAFLLMGSQCMYFQRNLSKYSIPKNVGFLGLVSEKEKQEVFDTVDFALNPMCSGSGTNLKMFDYMAAGVPVITTNFGTRGIQDTKGLICAEIEEMAREINDFSLADQEQLIRCARTTIDQQFDWKVISKTLMNKLREM